ncbi:MAG: adenylate/guanylate cyclase domain-containing protein [Chloroflexota bacterium]
MKQYSAEQYHGKFESVVLFMDISGFTQIAQSFLHDEKEGTEELASIINSVFEPIILTVEHHGGFVATFAGDAIMILFPEPLEGAVNQALQTAQKIREIFKAHGRYSTAYTSFELSVKQGIAVGEVEWGIAGSAEQKTYYFRGEAIQRSIEAETRAGSGEIILDELLVDLFESNLITLHRNKATYPSVNSEGQLLHSSPHLLNHFNNSELLFQFFKPDLWRFVGIGEFRQVATVFLSFSPDIDREPLTHLIEIVIGLCNRYGGHFIEVEFGDKGGVIMLSFGAPKTSENDLERALGFAVALKQMLKAFDTFWAIGLTFGQVYAGMIGAPLRAKYGLMGMTVNHAARLMSKAKKGQALVSEQVVAQVGFEFRPIGNLSLKGFDAPVLTFELVGLGAQGFDAQADQDTFFVGRKAEQRQLHKFARPLLDGEAAGIMMIFGEPGIGKSVLANQFVSDFFEETYWYNCSAEQILKQAFNPFVSCLKRYFQQSGDLTAKENKNNFLAQWQLLDAKLEDSGASSRLIQEFSRTRSFLGALLDLYWPGSLYEQLDSRLRYQNTLVAIKTWLFAQSFIQPVAILLEDAHWLDEASLQLIESISREISNYRILFLITSRYFDDDGAADLAIFHGAPQSVIHLEALEHGALRRQAEHLLGDEIDQGFCDYLLERSQGNPFFVEQLIIYFQEHDVLKQNQKGIWSLQSSDVSIPSTINSILVTRIDQLMQSAKEVVQTAAVLGAEFDVEVLNEMFLGDVSKEIKDAEDKQIWQSFNSIRYIFKHVLLRDAAYDMQLRQRLNELHLLAAEVYQKLYNNHLEPHYAALAYHYRAANAPDFERHYSLNAGEQAQKKGSHQEALAYFSRCIELSSGAELVDYILLREDVYHTMGDRKMQGQDLIWLSELAFENLLDDEAQHIERLILQSTVALRHARYRSAISDYPGAMLAAKYAIMLADETEDLDDLLEGRYWWGEALQQQGEYEKAKVQFELALKNVKYAVDPNLHARLLRELGWISFRQGDSISSIEKLGEGLLIAQIKGDPTEEMKIFKALGGAANGRGDYLAAKEWQLQGLAVAQEIGHAQEEGSLFVNLGNTSRYLGDYELAENYHLQGAEKVKKVGWRVGEGISLINLGFTQHYLGKHKLAMKHALMGLAVSQDINAKMIEGVAWYIIGCIYEKLNNFHDAELAYVKAEQISQQMDLSYYLAEARAGLIRTHIAQQRFDQMRPIVEQLQSYLLSGGSVRGALEPTYVYWTCYQAMALLEIDGANQVLQEAFEILASQTKRMRNKADLEQFIENVPYNRTIIETIQAFGQKKRAS